MDWYHRRIGSVSTRNMKFLKNACLIALSRSLFIDNQGGIWVGTYYDGINYYHPFAPTFKTLKYSPYFNSLNDKVVSCIVEEPSTKNLWIGTNDGGVNYYDCQKQTFSYYQATKQGNGLRSNNIKAISLVNPAISMWAHIPAD